MIYEIKIVINKKSMFKRIKPFIKAIVLICKELDLPIYENITQDTEKYEYIICREMSNYLKKEITPIDLREKTEDRGVIATRQVVIFYNRIGLKYSLNKSAEPFGQKHDMASYCVNKVRALIDTEKNYKEVIRNIEIKTNTKLI